MHKRRNSEFNDVNKYAIKVLDNDEKDYQHYLSQNKIAICETVVHETDPEKADNHKIKILTQISRSGEDCHANSGDRNGEDSLSHSHSSHSNSDYIKNITISHVGKSHSWDANHKTRIKTVIGNSKYSFETVFSTDRNHSNDQTSYTSYVQSYRSLPDSINNILNEKGERKSSKSKKKWKLNFKPKRTKNKKTSTREIDKLALDRVLQDKDVSEKVVTESNAESSLPFKSYTIGSPLPPIRKRKMPKPFKTFCEFMSLPKGDILQTYSTDTEKMNREKPTSVQIILKDKTFKYKTNLEVSDKNSKDYLDGEQLKIPASNGSKRIKSISESHIDMPAIQGMTLQAQEENTKRSQSCSCYDRKIELMSTALISMIDKVPLKPNYEREMANYNKKCQHFTDCMFHNRRPSLPVVFAEKQKQKQKQNINNSRSLHLKENNIVIENGISQSYQEELSKSTLSLYSRCHKCDEDSTADEQLCSELFKVIPQILEGLIQEKQIGVEEEHMSYLMQTGGYDEFEKGILPLIGPKCTLENVALLHFVVREFARKLKNTIMTYVEHQNIEFNESEKVINRISHYADEFFTRHYAPTIRDNYGSLEQFIMDELQKTPRHEVD